MIDEKCIQMHIGWLIEQTTHGILTISPRSSRLLIIAFQILGHIVMHDKGHVRFIDTHAKGIGRHDHRCAV